MENVSALLGRGIDRVLRDLAAIRYDAEWHCIPASYVGLRHLRDRVWIVAYTRYRRVGSIVRVSGVIKAFDQRGDEFLWKASVNDVADTSPGTTAKTRTLTVPTGIPMVARLRVLVVGSNQPFRSIISSLAQNDEAAGTNSNAGGIASGVANGQIAGSILVRTNASGQIRTRGESASGSEIYISTEGYVDQRGRV